MRLTKILIALAAFVLASCDSSIVYSEGQRVDEKGWSMDQALVFNCDVQDTSAPCICCIDLRNTDDYPFSNIYFFIKTIYPDGSVAVDTNIQFVLAENDGQWRGRRSGKYIDGRYPFCYFHFPQPGAYQFQISHAMRDTMLRGVKEVGLTIIKNKEK